MCKSKYLVKDPTELANAIKSLGDSITRESAFASMSEDIGINLKARHLRYADLREGAKLDGADLSRANLFEAKMKGAHLQRADLREAHLQGVDLRKAHLQGAFMEGLQLAKADLRGATMDSLFYLTPPDTLESPEWDRLILRYQDKIPVEVDRSAAFVQRLERAKARPRFTGAYPQPDRAGFIAMRQSMICDTLYPVHHLLLNRWAIEDDSLRTAINCPLLQTVNAHCPKRWKNWKWQEVDLEYYIPNGCANLDKLR